MRLFFFFFFFFFSNFVETFDEKVFCSLHRLPRRNQKQKIKWLLCALFLASCEQQTAIELCTWIWST